MNNGVQVEIIFNKAVIPELEKTIRDRMMEATNEVRNEVLETLSGMRTGRQYYVPGTKRLYTASAPGEPPAEMTGQLRKSIKTAVEGNARQTIGMVGTDIIYARALEYGATYKTHRMAPRPWLRPSLERARERIKEILSRKWL